MKSEVLKAFELLSEEEKELVKIELKEMGIALEDIEDYSENKFTSIPCIDVKEFYEVSSVQKRLYLLNGIGGAELAYNLPYVVEVEGHLNINKLEDVFIKIIKRHEALRTSFEEIDGQLVQKVYDHIHFKIDNIHIQDGDKEEDIIEAFIRPFDLSKAPLIRVSVVKRNENEHILMIDMHHIISDGTSIGILMKELSEFYEGKELDELRVQYKDYSAWQNKLFKDEKFKKQEKYWIEKFKGEIPVLNMPLDYQRPAQQSFEGDTIEFQLDYELTSKLRQLTKTTETTLYMVLLSAYTTLLYKYTDQEDIIVGSAVAGRSHADLQDMIGMFVNTLVMRNYPRGEKTFIDYLQEVKKDTLESFENGDYPFEELVDKLSIKRDMSRNPLFDTLFRLQNMDIRELEIEGLKIKPYNEHFNFTKFDITLAAVETNEGIDFIIEYCPKLFKKERIERMAGHFVNLLTRIVDNPEQKLCDIDILSEEERNMLLNEFNNTKTEYPRDKAIHQLFEEQVEKTPDNIAVVYENRHITYRELNEKSNQLARVLREKGVVPDGIVGIMAERSMEMVVGIMGILKAGGAYLPIDPEYPKDRVDYMLKDSGTGILLTQKRLNERTAYWGEIIELDEEGIYAGDGSNLEIITKSNDLVYVIYTSGSTGKPKGVMITNSSLANYTTWFANKAALCAGQKSLLLTSYAFDLGYTCIFPSILRGLELHILEKEKCINSGLVLDYIHNREITYIKLTPSIFANILDKVNETESNVLSSLGLIVLGGETINVLDIGRFNKLHPHVKIMNHYGPTETTIGTISHLIDFGKFEEYKNTPFIGKPINNACIYIIDKYSNLASIGMPGELCISGDGLARGYLNRPELTAERFIENPFEPGKRMYRTGDLARWLPGGNIEFLGRIDHQVKIRGFRIELGEIENRLITHGEIKEAVVAVKEDESGSKYLCAYIVGEKELTVSEIRGHLSKELPDYMIPPYFVRLDKMPLTPNGKIDRKALPEPEGNIDTGIEYEAPRNVIEHKLALIWQEVLKLESIGINDNFFELGGHSLKAASLAAKMHKELSVEFPIREIFKRLTIKEQAKYLKDKAESIYYSIKKAEEKDYYEASSAQKRMYALNQINRKSTNYNMPYVISINGSLDIEKIEAIISKIIERHEAFRTSFHVIEGEVVQRVHNSVDFKIGINNINCRSEEKLEIDKTLKKIIKPFDLDKAPLIRAEIIRLNDGNILLIDMHHIISDGVSFEIFIKEFNLLYEGKELDKVYIQYKDFSDWQNNLIEKGTLKKQEDYWLEQLSGELPVLNMPTDYKREKVQSFEGDHLAFEIETDLREKINKLLQRTGTTRHMLFLSLLNILLSKYTSQEDIIIGTPVVGRTHADLENAIGMFVNTLAIRSCPSGEKTFIEFLEQVKENTLKAFENQDYQFEKLIENLNIITEDRRNPLFDVMFIMQNSDEGLKIGDLDVSMYETEHKISKLDLSVIASDDGIKTQVTIEYSTKLYNKETIERLKEHYVNILYTIAEFNNIKLKDIELVTEKEKRAIVEQFNNTKVEYPRNKTVKELFEKSAAINSNKIAVVSNGVALTYKELNENSNRIANYLRKNGITKDDIVGIVCDRSVETVAAIIGIVKSGGIYLPIDEEYPQHRIEYMLTDSKSKIVIGKAGQLEKIKGSNIEKIDIESKALLEESVANPSEINTAEDLIYLIYTSGSEGNPKAVCVEHRGVIRLVQNNNHLVLDENDRILKVLSMGFDPTVIEIWGSLLNGITLFIAQKRELLDIEKLEHMINKNKITFLQLSSSLFVSLVSQNVHIFENVKQLIVGGDVIPPNIVSKVVNTNPNIKVTNAYGPTENTVTSTAYTVQGEWDIQKTIPIGKPISNSTCYIMNRYSKLLPVGVAGELCVGGDGVARGYLNREELTAAKFIENPYVKGERLYKTGDLARWLQDGNIEFLGRIDNQVKIRGYRIELGEIENRLLKHEHIREAVVIVNEYENGGKYLTGYIKVDKKLTVSELRTYLLHELPDYMIPQYFVQVDEIPLTLNGKIDKKALPEPDRAIETDAKYEAPRYEIEETLASIWEKVLNLDDIGINDNFFELGGHSLKAISVVSMIHKQFNIELSLTDLFKTPTIKGLGEYIKVSDENICPDIEPAEEKEYYPLSPAQKRIYTVQQFDKDSISYNMPSIFVLGGNIDKNILESTLKKLIERHESLRTSFMAIQGEIVQKVHELVDFKMEYVELEEEDIDTHVHEFLKPFDLSKAPLIRVKLAKLDNSKSVLVIDMHHIISDGVSMGIFINELSTLYEGEELPALKIQYKDYTIWQDTLMKSKKAEKQEKYWMEKFSGEMPTLNLPTDYSRQAIQSFRGDSVDFEISPDLSNKLRKLAKETNSTLNMILLAVFNILLSKYSRQEDIIVGTVTAGRTHTDLGNVIGMFVNTLAIRNHPNGEKSFTQFLDETKKASLEAYENQDYQFENLIEKVKLKRDISRNPLFDVMFLMQNIDQKDFQIKDIIIKPYDSSYNIAKFDITLTAMEHKGKILFNICYCIDLFKKDTILAMQKHYIEILESIIENKHICINDINLSIDYLIVEDGVEEEEVYDLDFNF